MQKGKCAITNMLLTADVAHCHHKIPISLGGTDDFSNLVLVHKLVHRLIHATNVETINKYIKILSLNAMQFRKLNQYRALCKLESI